MTNKRMFLIACAVILLLTACQPTPAEDIIVNRGDGALEEAIAATAVPSEQPLLPVDEVGERVERWTDELPRVRVWSQPETAEADD